MEFTCDTTIQDAVESGELDDVLRRYLFAVATKGEEEFVEHKMSHAHVTARAFRMIGAEIAEIKRMLARPLQLKPRSEGVTTATCGSLPSDGRRY